MWSDIRHVLPVVQVPTLVIHQSGNCWMTPAHGRYLAENIADARYVEVPGSDWPRLLDAFVRRVNPQLPV